MSLQDDAIIAQVLKIIYAENDRQRELSNTAKEEGRMHDVYRHNTALWALWDVAAKISAIGTESPADERDGRGSGEAARSHP